jgi:hypothetical protein
MRLSIIRSVETDESSSGFVVAGFVVAGFVIIAASGGSGGEDATAASAMEGAECTLEDGFADLIMNIFNEVSFVGSGAIAADVPNGVGATAFEGDWLFIVFGTHRLSERM